MIVPNRLGRLGKICILKVMFYLGTKWSHITRCLLTILEFDVLHTGIGMISGLGNENILDTYLCIFCHII